MSVCGWVFLWEGLGERQEEKQTDRQYCLAVQFRACRDAVYIPVESSTPWSLSSSAQSALWSVQITVTTVVDFFELFSIVVSQLQICSTPSFHTSRWNHQIIKDKRFGPGNYLTKNKKKYLQLATFYLICMQLPSCSSILHISRSQK